MNWTDNNSGKLFGVSRAEEITEALNYGLSLQGINNRYYIKSVDTDGIHISTVPSGIYEIPRLNKYMHPKQVSHNLKSLIENLQENINLLQNFPVPASASFSDEKVFKLNDCYHNSAHLFHLVQHLSNIKAIRLTKPVQIAFGYVCNKVPFGTQIGNKVIESHIIYLHDWHVWNYIENVLVDLSMFNNGGLINPHGNFTTWGTSQDHVFIFPPNNMQYWGVAFTDYIRFNELFSDILGIK